MQNFTQKNAILVNSAVTGSTMGVQGNLRGLALQEALRPDTGSMRPQSDSYSRIGIGNFPIPGFSPLSPAGRLCSFGSGTGCGELTNRGGRGESHAPGERGWQGHDRVTGMAQLSVDAVAAANVVFAARAASAAPVAQERQAEAETTAQPVAPQGDAPAAAAAQAKPARRTKRSAKPAEMPAAIWATLVLSRALSS